MIAIEFHGEDILSMLKNFAPLFLLAVSIVAMAEEPKPYSVNRYSPLWQSKAFQESAPLIVATPPPPAPKPPTDWSVVGVFTLKGKQGAIIMNSASGAIEQVGEDFESPSGIRLTRIYSTAFGQQPRIEVSLLHGERIALTGLQPGNAVVNQNSAKSPPSQSETQLPRRSDRNGLFRE